MSFLNDKLKTKKAGHSDGFRTLTDSTENERNISLSKSSRHFLRDLEIKGAMGQITEHGMDNVVISPDNKIEPYGTTTPVNANEVEGRVPDGFIELESLYCTGAQYCKIPGIIKTIDFHMIVKAASFKVTPNHETLFSIQNQNDSNTAFEVRVPDENCDTNTYCCAFSMPMVSHSAADSSGLFEVGITDTCKGWRAGAATLNSVDVDQMAEGVWSVTGRLGDTQVYSGTYYTNNKEICFFRCWNNSGFYFDGSFSYALIYNGKEKISELVAAKRKSDGSIGILEIYGERRGEFYESLGDDPFYSSYPDRSGLSEKEKTLYKLTLKSAKRGLPKGYKEITELVSPGVPWAGKTNNYDHYTRVVKLPIERMNYDLIYDFETWPTVRSGVNFMASILVGEIEIAGVDFSSTQDNGLFAQTICLSRRIFKADSNEELSNYRDLACDYTNLAHGSTYTPSAIGLVKRFVISCETINSEKHPTISIYCNARSYGQDHMGKFNLTYHKANQSWNHSDTYLGTCDITFSRPNFISYNSDGRYSGVTGFRFKRITIKDKNENLLWDIRACKKEDTGEFGIYSVNYETSKEEFTPFILEDRRDIEALKAAGLRWQAVESYIPFPEESQTYLSGESTLLRDIKETTIYLPEPLHGLPNFCDSLSITNKTGEKSASLVKTIGTRTLSGGPIADVPDNMKAYGIEYPGVVADNPDWNETSIENLTAFSATASGHYVYANLTQNPNTNRWELAGYGDSVAIVVPKSINTTDGRIANLADNALSHERFDTASGHPNRSWAQLKKLYIPNGYTVLPSGLCYFNNYLEKVIIPSELKEIGVAAFHYNHRIKKLLPTNFYGKVPENIDIVIPNSVTKIGAAAFDAVGLYGSNRMRVCIGESVNYLGYTSLSGKFSDIYLPNNIATMGFNGTLGVFGNRSGDLSNLHLYCNKNTLTYNNLKTHLTSVYNLTEEQADARIITEDKGGGYINFNVPDTFNIYYAAFNYFYLSGGMVLPIVSDKFQEVPGSQNPNPAHNNRSYLSLNFTGPFQVTCQSWYHDWTPQSPAISGRAARIWFTLPKEYDTVGKAREYFAQNPTTFYVIGKDKDKIPIDMSKVEIGDGERELFIENEFGALSSDGTSGYGTMLSNFVLGDRKNPSYTKVQYYSNKSK